MHGLVHLAQIEDEDNERACRKRARQHHAGPEPEHQAGSNRHDDLNQRQKLGLEASGPQRDLDAFQALFFQAALFIVLAGEGFDYPDGRKHLLHHGNDFPLFFPDLPRSLLDATRVSVNNCKEYGDHRQGNQGETPVQIEHYSDHTQQRQAINQDAQQPRGDEALDSVNVTRDAADKIARLLLIVKGQ